MKKVYLFLISAILLLLLALSFVGLQKYRYQLNSPMEDMDYKKTIIQNSHNLTYTLEALRPLVGQEELKKFIKEKSDSL